MNSGLRVLSLSALGVTLLLSRNDRQVRTSVDPPKKALSTVLASELYRPVLSAKAKELIERHKDVFEKTRKNTNGGLIDASTFVSETQRADLDKLAGKKGGFGLVEFNFLRLQPKENGYQYALDVDYGNGEKERWYASVTVYYPDQYPDDIPLDQSSIALWKGTKDGGVDKLTHIETPYEPIFGGGEYKNYDYLLKLLNEAKSNRTSELKDPAKVKDFDLPKNRQIGYIGLIDLEATADPFEAGSIDDVKCLPEIMNSIGYNFVVNKRGRNAIEVNANPKDVIEAEIQSFVNKGVTDICLKLSAHGNERGVYFQSQEKGKSYVFTPRDLTGTLNKFLNCNFTIATDACSAGGFEDALKRYRDPSGVDGRVMLFVQSKILGYNQEGRLKGIPGQVNLQIIQIPNGLISVPALSKAQISPKAFSTYYDTFLYNHLLNGERYGMAHWLADQDVKRLISCDAGVIKSTPGGGVSTSMLNNRSLILSI